MEASLLQRYRRDRRKLLDFLLSPSSGFIKEIRTYSGGPAASISSIDFDTLSADYILDCIQSGGVLDISEATRKFTAEAQYPIMMNSQLGDSYFLVSDPESAGSPPRRVPPSIVVNHANNHKLHPSDGLVGQNIAFSGDEYKVKYAATKQISKPVKNINIPSLGLPALHTGLSDDDLRESAYEILLTCMAFYGLEIYSFEDQKKDKSSRFLAGLKNKRDKRHPRSQSPEKHAEFIDTIRVQMQISEAMDACVRQRSMQFASRKACGQLDIPQISLGLLNGIFKTDFLYEKPYMQWKKRQVNTLEELFSSANHITEQQTVGTLLAKINNSEEWDNLMSPSERTEVLTAIRQVSLLLASVPGRFGMQGETCYWTVGYHLNIRLYEKLLFGLFDILEEGHLIEGADEILKLCKLTWSTLGITQKMHDALYGWVLFQQFVLTEEESLLDHAIPEVQKVLSAEINKGNDEEYLNSLICSPDCNGTKKELSLVEAIFWSMSFWCDSKLQDYHLHFSQKPVFFRRVMTLALALRNYSSGKSEENKLMASDTLSEIDDQNVRMYVENSVEAAYRRVEDGIDFGSQMERTNPLSLLASEVRLIAEKELTEFSPVLSDWYPEAARVAAILLHQLYGERLKPFLMEVSSLSEEVKLVLPAADMLEHGLTRLFSSACKENGPQTPSCLELDHYQVGEICRPVILDWVIAQHARILEWTGRTLNLEEWEPLSHQQKQSSSAVEVFRIIEETVDQFFGLSLPMDITHLQALLSIIFHSLDSYLLKVVSQLVEKHHLYPPVPPLTRYKEAVFPVIKKKVVEHVLLEEEVNSNLNELTISKLCIRLNTLQYIQKQMGTLEDGIRKSWASATPSENTRDSEEHPEASDAYGESVDELFVATFDSLRDTAADAIRRICDFIGARVVFWDLRDSFLFRLYRGSVGGARFDSIIPHFDSVLNNICGFVDDILRDLVVASICKASLDGYVWVLLDGGPSCAFSDSDITMMEDDLNLLKEFFVADGEGLPRSFVENEAKIAHQILDLFSLQTESVIQMLMTASEHIPTGPESHNHGHRHLGDAHTLVRVLCHKKDREASKFLKRQYQLPASSEYDDDDGPLKDSGSTPPKVADIFRSASLRWSDNGNSSFRSIKKKLQSATAEIRHTGSPTYS